MKGMTNNQIIMNEAAKLDPATLHAIATAHHTPDEIAAIAAACKTTDENGNEQPATVAGRNHACSRRTAHVRPLEERG